MWDYILYGLLGLLVLLILVILIRTFTFNDKTNYNRQIEFNEKQDDVVFKLGEMLKIKTISHEDISKTDFSKFQEYIDLTKKLYPTVFEKCEFTQTKEYAIKL